MKRIITLFILAFILFIPQIGSAHASLIDAFPIQYDHVQKMPNQVSLTFSEKIQDELYYLKVFDDKGNLVSNPKTTKLSSDHIKLSVDLKPIKKGNYTVSYHIVCDDGHVVDYSYIFTYGNDVNAAPSIPKNFSNSGNGHAHGGYQYLFYAAYYILFLAFAGWIMIGVLRRNIIKDQKTEWYKALRFFFLVSCVLYSLTDFMDATAGFGSKEWSIFFLQTSTGIVAGIRVVMAIIAQFALQKNRIVDAAWVLAIILLEAYNGHAVTFAPIPVTIGFDAIHLIAAAFWVGGLVYLVIHFRKGVPGYLSFFSRGAFISLVVLVISGSIITFIFTPSLAAIPHSSWGILLILKVFLVLFVFLIAAIVRSRLKKVNPHSTHNWVKVDITMMLIILIIVGVMTHLSPYPTNDPLDWRTSKMGYDVTALIYPINPGATNTINITVASGLEKVENVDLILKNEDKSDLAPINVPLKKVKTQNKNGETIVTYNAKGAFLSLPGTWHLELQIYNENDDYTILKHDLTIYKIKQ